MININIKSTNFHMTPDIQDYITSKMSSVEKFLQVQADEEMLVDFEIEKSAHHKKGDVFRAEANFRLKGIMHRGEATESDVRTAIDNVKDQIEKQIRRSKTRRFELFERGARTIKKMLRKNNND